MTKTIYAAVIVAAVFGGCTTASIAPPPKPACDPMVSACMHALAAQPPAIEPCPYNLLLVQTKKGTWKCVLPKHTNPSARAWCQKDLAGNKLQQGRAECQ